MKGKKRRWAIYSNLFCCKIEEQLFTELLCYNFPVLNLIVMYVFFNFQIKDQKKEVGKIYSNVFCCRIEEQLFTELLCHFQYSI